LELMDSSKKLLKDARSHAGLGNAPALTGALGVAIFLVMESAKKASMSKKEIEELKAILIKAMSSLSEQECNIFCQVIKTTLDEKRDKDTGVWY